MKRFILVLSMFLAAKSMMAEGLSVDAVALPQGLQTELTIRYQFDEADVYSGYQLTMILPEGVSLVSYTEGDCYQESHTVYHNYVAETNENIFACLSGASDVLKGNVGDVIFGTIEAVAVSFDNVAFDIEIAEPLIVLDETSTTLPVASEKEVPINVKRTIRANEWSTICCPFSMTEAQVYEAFGEDVQLMEFDSYEADDNLTSIEVYFYDCNETLAEDGFMANYPYIIKTTKDITEFTVTSKIDPEGEGGITEFTNGKSGSRKEVYGTFYGTLKSGTVIPNNSLFLNGNNFYYSAGYTPIMGFRGYFEFVDILSSVGNAASAITLRIGEETTSLEALQKGFVENGKVYDLQGRIIENPGKGIYIKNNKKIIIK